MQHRLSKVGNALIGSLAPQAPRVLGSVVHKEPKLQSCDRSKRSRILSSHERRRVFNSQGAQGPRVWAACRSSGSSYPHLDQGGQRRCESGGGGILERISGSLQDLNLFGDRKVTGKDWKVQYEGDYSWETLVSAIYKRLEFADKLLTVGSQDALQEHQDTFGFNLSIEQSKIPGAGRGLFLAHGSFREGDILTLYPGTVYTINRLLDLATFEAPVDTVMGPPSAPQLPMFMFRNKYLLQEKSIIDQGGQIKYVDLITDGNPYGQSALRFLKEQEDMEAEKTCSTLIPDPYRPLCLCAATPKRSRWNPEHSDGVGPEVLGR
mmetsp:Transcript_33787/g.52630  ORF Transcript_33787/g.52630 Transcript_33787/m.52630 type:complete len:321 (-) Transcript_33787:634-1596(-)